MYQKTKIYDIDGLRVTSVVTSDEVKGDPQRLRVIILESSCESKRWGTRKRPYSYSTGIDYLLDSDLEQIRRQEAENLAAIERGSQPEETPAFLMVKLHGPSGTSFNSVASANLAVGPTLLSPDFISHLKLEDSGQRYGEWTSGGMQQIPLYKLTIEYWQYRVETLAMPARVGACVIGGEFFAKALENRPKLVYELLGPDHVRALYNAARCKRSYVLITGKYGEHRDRLVAIQKAITEIGFTGLILDELYDIEAAAREICYVCRNQSLCDRR